MNPPDQPNSIVAGEKLTLRVDAKYFFGEPLVNAKVDVDVFNLAPYYWSWWGDESPDLTDYYWQPTSTVKFTKRHESDGTIEVDLTVPELAEYESFSSWRSSSTYATYAVEVSVQDESKQPGQKKESR